MFKNVLKCNKKETRIIPYKLDYDLFLFLHIPPIT